MSTETDCQLRNTIWNLRNVVAGLICDTFMACKLKHCPEQALEIEFRAEGDLTFCLLLWAPMNYVGVFWRERHGRATGHWRSIAYHDSCWRTDGVARFVDRVAARIEGLGLHGQRVIQVSPDWRETLRAALKKADETGPSLPEES